MVLDHKKEHDLAYKCLNESVSNILVNKRFNFTKNYDSTMRLIHDNSDHK